MTEQSFILRSPEIAFNAIRFIRSLVGGIQVFEVVIRPYEKTRTDGQNRRYWSDLTHQLDLLAQEIKSISDHTGYTPLEVRKLIAKDLEPEHAALLFTLSPEAAHEVLKVISGIPTSTRLGTKEFSQFEDRMIQIVAEIVGQVRYFGERAQ
jgi:hypothetical protein